MPKAMTTGGMAISWKYKTSTVTRDSAERIAIITAMRKIVVRVVEKALTTSNDTALLKLYACAEDEVTGRKVT